MEQTKPYSISKTILKGRSVEIRIRGLEKNFGQTKVLKKIDLRIASGSFTTILGPSGCGKTTLLRCLAGLETPSSGDIEFDGTPVFSSERALNVVPEKRKLGFVFQDFALWPHLTVFENVAFGLRAQMKTEGLEAKVADALRAVRLEGYGKRRPHELSGGQQQRVAFARALAVEPGCILFDEPLSALDAVLRDEMRVELRALVRGRGLTAVFVTHDQTEALTLSDRVVVMDRGRVAREGSPEEVYADPQDEFVARFVGRSNWFEDGGIIRPEDLSFEPRGGALSRDFRVLDCVYSGGTYQLSLAAGDLRWQASSRTRLAPGEPVTVHFDPARIVRLNKESQR